ncbi:hypothetical protein TNCV_859951 [Trichonephila clavipes]|nr:hypothetical protein TNCV_859951 [Trichonephila clavipes]
MLELNTLSILHIPFIFLELIGNKREFIFPKKTPKKISGKVPYRFVTPCTRDSAQKTLEPTDLTNPYAVCPRRVFSGIGHRTQAFQTGVRCSY